MDVSTNDCVPVTMVTDDTSASPKQADGDLNASPRAARLKIHEIFHSLQGEADAAGWPTAFIRLTGCPLRCVYCDTEYAFTGGDWRSVGEIMDLIATYQVRHVCVTGGEPLAQRRCTVLLKQLCDAGYEVSLETSGALDVAPVDQRVRKVLDLKTPASGECQRNLWSNIDHLTPRDQIKFVICDQDDYDWAVAQVRERALPQYCQVLFSPSYEQLPARTLAEWILRDRLPVRFQMQLHKQLWGEEPGR
ncbi:MAG: 7-carboxy-7-deazaguanine synthase QueE [Wenzhouxiangellaceae bacterium]